MYIKIGFIIANIAIIIMYLLPFFKKGRIFLLALLEDTILGELLEDIFLINKDITNIKMSIYIMTAFILYSILTILIWVIIIIIYPLIILFLILTIILKLIRKKLNN